MNNSIDKSTNEPYHKHPKITPKKKPIPIAVLPKPSVPKSTFNPSIKTSKLKNDIALNINTSKRWVLPPRPRPGRKPVNEPTTGGPSLSSTPLNGGYTLINGGSNGSTTTNTPLSSSSSNNNSISSTPSIASPPVIKDGNSPLPSDNRPINNAVTTTETVNNAEDSPELNKLKLSYLSKLKEQELIFNYIDVINNQINQLDFIKNGYISHDTLNQIERHEKSDRLDKPDDMINNFNFNGNETITNGNPTISNIGISTGRVKELENINNFQDLNKFLNYMIKSSNLIHRVTKNYQGNINSQIENYLKLRHNNVKRQDKKSGLGVHQQPEVNKLGKFKHGKLNNLSQNLLNEGNLFDKLVINDEFICGICKKPSPCFCLDIDK